MDTRITWPTEALTRGALLGLVPAGLADRMGMVTVVISPVTALMPGANGRRWMPNVGAAGTVRLGPAGALIRAGEGLGVVVCVGVGVGPPPDPWGVTAADGALAADVPTVFVAVAVNV